MQACSILMGVGSRYPSLPPGVSHVIILPTILLVQPAIQRSPQPPPWLTRRPLHCRGGGAARHGARLLLPFYITIATSGAMLVRESWHCVDRAAIELARSTRTMLLAEPAFPRRSAAWLLALRAAAAAAGGVQPCRPFWRCASGRGHAEEPLKSR